jgi:hypothetical protein
VTREQRKDLVEILSALAIVISLIFVGLEVNQNTNAVRSTVVQAVSQQSYDAIVLLVESSELRAAQAAIEGAPPDEQRRLLYLYYGALLRVQLNRFMQVKLGVIDSATVLALGGDGGIYDNASFRAFWLPRRDNYDPEFVSFVEESVFSE